MKNASVLTYVDPTALDVEPQTRALMGAVHICATSSLKLAMISQYGLKGLQYETRNLFKHLLWPWMDDAVRVRQHSRLSRLVEGLRAGGPPDWQPHLRALRRNLREVLLAIRTLVEGGLRATDLKPATVDEQIFQHLFAEMEKADRAIDQVRSLLYGQFNQPDRLRRAIDEALAKVFEEEAEREARLLEISVEEALKRREPPALQRPPRHANRLVVHGFYFITPLQMRFMELCDSADIHLIFLNCYDPRYPAIFRTWEAFFDPANGLPGPSQWQNPTALPALDDERKLLAELFEGRLPAGRPAGGDVRIRKFEDFGSFVQQFLADHPPLRDGGADNGRYSPVYIGPEADTVNRFLREYYPVKEGVQDRHFLAYPVGQLLFHLHKLWSEEDGELQISERSLFECFASGWLQTGGLNGKDYLRPLEDLLPFFAGCQSLAQWRERAKLLLEIRTGVVARFDTPVPGGAKNHRFHRYLNNPLERLAHFKVEAEKVTAIIALMERLFEIGEQIFGDAEIEIGAHMRRIESMLLQGVDKSALANAEFKLLEDLRRRLESNADTADKFLPRDLAEAITFYLGGDLSPDDNQDQDPSELNPNHYVSPFDRLDGVLYHRGRPLHLCLLGEKSLPKRKSTFPWPLTAKSFAHMPNHPTVRMLVLREEQSANADRYLMHYALCWGGDITLSYVAKWQDEVNGPSPYLVLLEPYLDGATTALQPWSPGLKLDQVEAPWDPTVRADQFERMPADALAEYALCPRRFFYSFLAQESPAYCSDFHHQFLYGTLAKSFASLSRQPLDRVVAEMEPLFPQWTGLLRQDLLERTPQPRRDHDRYDGWDYPKARYGLNLVITRREEMDAAITVLEESDAAARQVAHLNDRIPDGEAILPAAPSVACRYCPHIGRCDAAQYAVDDE